MSNFNQKSKKFFGAPKVGQKTALEGPKSLTDVPDVLIATDPAAADREILEVLEKKDPKAADWIRSLGLPAGALTYSEVISWLGNTFRNGLTAERFKEIRMKKMCPYCGRSGCMFALSAIAEVMGW